MLSADEAMLGGIPDREAPLPYIPKAWSWCSPGGKVWKLEKVEFVKGSRDL